MDGHSVRLLLLILLALPSFAAKKSLCDRVTLQIPDAARHTQVLPGARVVFQAPESFQNSDTFSFTGSPAPRLEGNIEGTLLARLPRRWGGDDYYILSGDRLVILRQDGLTLKGQGGVSLRPQQVASSPKEVTSEVARAFERLMDLVDKPIPERPRFPVGPIGLDEASQKAAWRLFERDGQWSDHVSARRQIFTLMAEANPNRSAVTEWLIRHLESDPDPFASDLILRLLQERKLITSDNIDRLLKIHFQDSEQESQYWHTLLGNYIPSNYTHEEIFWDHVPVAALAHPDPLVRSQAINYVRLWGQPRSYLGLRDPAVEQRMRDLRPNLTGFAKEAVDYYFRKEDAISHPGPLVGEFRPEEHPLFLRLLEDTCTDCEDFKRLDPRAREAFLAMKGKIHKLDDPHRLDALKAVPWGKLNEPWPAAKKPGDRTYYRLDVPFDEYDYGHSMPDFQDYVENRLGKETARAIRNHEANVFVYAGSLERFRGLITGFDPKLVRKIPSPYSEWGVEKYFYGEKEPAILIRIPPIEQYAWHYHRMLHGIGAQGGVFIDHADQAAYREGFKTAARTLMKEIPEKPSIAVLGYSDPWMNVLKTRTDFKTESLGTYHYQNDGFDITARVVRIQSTILPGKEETMVFLSSENTLWGEATSHLMEGVLDGAPSLRKVWFAGSAGAINLPAVYAPSVPSEFTDKEGKKIAIANSLLPQGHLGHSELLQPTGAEAPVPFHLGGIHGFTNTPAEQTRQVFYDGMFSRSGTLDVETSLLAQMIATRNAGVSDTGQKIQFGAGHVLTDNPAGIQTYDMGSSLSDVKKEKKEQGRDTLIHFMIDMIGQGYYRESPSFDYLSGVGIRANSLKEHWYRPTNGPKPILLRYDTRGIAGDMWNGN